MSISYHSQGREENPLLFRMEVAAVFALIGATITFFVLNNKDKNTPLEYQDSEKNKTMNESKEKKV